MIGSLRHRITIQQNFPHRINGVKQDAWGDVATVYARVEPLSGREVPTASQIEGRVLHRITMRFRPRLADQFQFLDGTGFNFLDGEPFIFTGLTDPIQFLNDEVWQFLDGDDFLYVNAPDGPLPRFRIKFGNRTLDIRDVQQLYPHDEFTVLRAEEAL